MISCGSLPTEMSRRGNPALQVIIVGSRNPKHIDYAIAAADLELDASALRRIEDIISDEVRVGGPSPESV